MAAGGAIGAADGITVNPDQNLNAIDLEVGTVAAQASSGIYLQELAAGGSLIVGNVPSATVTVNVQQVDFRSTVTPVSQTRTLNQLDDLQTTNNGPIKVIVEAGSLIINEGNDNDNIGVFAQGTGDTSCEPMALPETSSLRMISVQWRSTYPERWRQHQFTSRR